MVDNGSGKNFDVVLIGKFLCICYHFDIEGQNGGEFLLYLFLINSLGSFENIFPVYRSDINAGNRNIHLMKVLE